MALSSETGVIVLDDGRYYVELNCNYAPEEAPGFLQRRCYVGVTTPGGYECIGGFDREPSGKWRADIAAPYNPATDSDCRVVAASVGRLDALAALWAARHEAQCRHSSD